MKPRNYKKFLTFTLHGMLMLSLASGLQACGGNSPSGGIASNILVLVTDNGGQPIAGATVWVPEDFPALGLALTDSQGNTCADPPEPALFSACTGSDGIALLECGGNDAFLFKFQKDSRQGSSVGTCGQDGVVPASF